MAKDGDVYLVLTGLLGSISVFAFGYTQADQVLMAGSAITGAVAASLLRGIYHREGE